jgi:hypothetical protein
VIEWLPALERPPPRTKAQPEGAGLFYWTRRYNAPMRTLLLVPFLCSTMWSQTEKPPETPPATKDNAAQVAQHEKGANQNDGQANETAREGLSSAPENQSHASDRAEEIEISRQLARFTFWLVVVGALQLIALAVQAGVLYHHGTLIRESVGQMEKAVTAYQEVADLTRKSLILAQRPRLIVRNVEIDPSTLLGGKPEDFAGTLQVYNSGGSKAHVSAISCRLFCFDKLPMKAPFDPPVQSGNIELPPGFYGTRSFASGFDANDFRTFRTIREKRTGLYMMGELVYSDDLGLLRTKRFCRKFDWEQERFLPVTDPDYETNE